jgi:molybdate transport system substrate-binding protein
MRLARNLFGGLAAALMLLGAVEPAAAEDGKKPVLIFAAASLKTALDEIIRDWTRETGMEAKASYAASSALAKQIEQGAPADLFVSADVPWMDYVAEKGLIEPASRVDLLGNALVLVAGEEWRGGDVALKPGVDLAAMLGGGRLAMGDPSTVPAGRYGKAALETLGAWNAVSSRIAAAENVRAALALVSRGEAPLGIVYRTDAKADPSVRVVATFPADLHPPVVYPAARLKGAPSPQAEALLKRLASPAARRTFEAAGFAVLAPPSGS